MFKLLVLACAIQGQVTANDWVIVPAKVNEKVVLTPSDGKDIQWDTDDFPPERYEILGNKFVGFPIAPGEYRMRQIQWDTKKIVKLKIVVSGKIPDVIPDPKKPDVPPPPPINTDKDPDFTSRLSGAFSKDVALSQGDFDDLAQMKSDYLEGIKSFIPTSKTNQELFAKQKAMLDANIGPLPRMKSVREEIGAYVKTNLGGSPTAAPTTATPVWSQIADSLGRIK